MGPKAGSPFPSEATRELPPAGLAGPTFLILKKKRKRKKKKRTVSLQRSTVTIFVAASLETLIPSSGDNEIPRKYMERKEKMGIEHHPIISESEPHRRSVAQSRILHNGSNQDDARIKVPHCVEQW